MKATEAILFSTLGISSLLAGGTFGLLDIFGFIDGRHALSIQLLLFGAFLTYIQVIITFLLNFVDSKVSLSVFALCGLLFALVFGFLSSDILLAGLAGSLHGLFLFYTHTQSHSRSLLFIRFEPTEIFFPVLKTSLTYFLIFLSLLAYSQSHSKIRSNTLISPEIIHLVSKPTVFMLNRQLNGQLQSGASAKVLESLPPSQRSRTIRTSLQKTVEAMADAKTQTLYGIPVSDIPTNKTRINPQGTIDIAPVAESLYPLIARMLNERIQTYPLVAPLIVALAVYVFMQTLIVPLRFIEALTTRFIFWLLRRLTILKIQTVQKDVEVPHF